MKKNGSVTSLTIIQFVRGFQKEFQLLCIFLSSTIKHYHLQKNLMLSLLSLTKYCSGKGVGIGKIFLISLSILLIDSIFYLFFNRFLFEEKKNKLTNLHLSCFIFQLQNTFKSRHYKHWCL